VNQSLVKALLAEKEQGNTQILYGVATAKNTVTIAGSTVAVALPALTPVVSGDYCAVLASGADRLILGRVGGTAARTWACDAKFGTSTTNLIINRAEYTIIDHCWIAGYVDIELSGTPGSGSFSVVSPFPRTLDHNTGQTIGGAHIIDQNTARLVYPVFANADDTRIYVNSGGFGSLSTMTNTSPFTFGGADGITLNFMYRADIT
jgi:hypothetical protein